MVLTSIEIFALIVAIAVAIKILVLLTQPKSWLSVVKTVFAKPVLAMVVELILASVILYYLLAELNIVQIFAVMLFFSLLMTISFTTYSKETISWARKMLNKNVIKKAWLAILIWVILIVWVLYALFI